jgi:hypothetical protein
MTVAAISTGTIDMRPLYAPWNRAASYPPRGSGSCIVPSQHAHLKGRRRICECPLWVTSRHVRRNKACPLYPNSEIDCVFQMSAKGHKWTLRATLGPRGHRQCAELFAPARKKWIRGDHELKLPGERARCRSQLQLRDRKRDHNGNQRVHSASSAHRTRVGVPRMRLSAPNPAHPAPQ